MEIFFSVIAGIFAILAGVFGVKNRIKNSRLGTNGRVRDDGSRLNDIVSNHKRLKQYKERVGKLDKRDDDNIRRCSEIGERIRKREQETTTSE